MNEKKHMIFYSTKRFKKNKIFSLGKNKTLLFHLFAYKQSHYNEIASSEIENIDNRFFIRLLVYTTANITNAFSELLFKQKMQ